MCWRSVLVLCLVLAAGERDVRAQLTKTKTTTPYTGIVHEVWTDPSVPLKLHLVRVDVTSQEIHLSATQSGERGQTVSDWANCKKASTGCVPSDVAVNGDLFTPLGYVPSGLAIGGAKAWADANLDNATEGYFAFGRPGDINAVYLSLPANIEQPPAALAVEGAVGGRTLLVQGGQPMSMYDPADPTEPYRFAPRTALALDDQKHTLYVLVVDGDQAASAGMTSEEAANFLVSQGASDAIELDGGGSSTLYIRNEKGVVNAPSDGVQRTVANHLGFRFGVSPYRASVVGLVYDQKFGDMNSVINNATVYVDGTLATWNTSAPAHTIYNVDNVQPHFVCAKASAPGHKSATQCRQITAADIQMSQIQYLSLVLYPGTDPPPDMAVPPDLAMHTTPPDFAVNRDAGIGDTEDPGSEISSGCNLAATREVPSFFWLLVVLCLGAAVKVKRRA